MLNSHYHLRLIVIQFKEQRVADLAECWISFTENKPAPAEKLLRWLLPQFLYVPVLNIKNLRVAAELITPIIPSANSNCPTMMVG